MNLCNILNTTDLYLVALSGGADSVALLLLLKEQGCNIHAAHCNFHLRGEESDRDERFCVELCERFGVELHRAHFDTRTYAELHKLSIEMAARELRYRWFCQLCRDIGAPAVCVAHHRDDSVETVLLNLVRGTGLRGLTGIQPQSVLKTGDGELTILRPLLSISRAEIEQYLAEKGQDYVTDSTNLTPDVLRNKVRLQVLPLLRELNPAVVSNIQRTAENLAAAQAALDDMLSSCDDNQLDISGFKNDSSREYVAYEWLKKYGFNGHQVIQILEAETGAVISSMQGFDVLKDRQRLLVEPTLQPMKPLKIPEEGLYTLNEHCRLRVVKHAPYISKSADVATVDMAKVRFPLTVRRVGEGDAMHPFGMKGRKLLSDLMTDRKMTLFQKRRQLVVADAQGIIIWAVGLRTDDRCRVDDATKQVLELRYSE